MVKEKCPRCGRMIGRMDFHRPSCDKFPLADELLQIMRDEGLSQKQIAKRFDVSPHYVRHFVAHFGLRHMLNPYESKHGRNIESITGDSKCIACGVKIFVKPPESWGNVGVLMIGGRCEWCHEKGYVATKFRRPGTFTDDDILSMRAMRENGETYQEISVRFGTSYSYVQRVCTGVARLLVGGYIENIS